MSPNLIAACSFIECKINGHTVTAIVDTGAYISILSPEIVKKCNIFHQLDRDEHEEDITGGKVLVFGMINECPVQIGRESIVIKWRVQHASSPYANCIIGADFLTANQCILDFELKILRIGSSGDSIGFLHPDQLFDNVGCRYYVEDIFTETKMAECIGQNETQSAESWKEENARMSGYSELDNPMNHGAQESKKQRRIRINLEKRTKKRTAQRDDNVDEQKRKETNKAQTDGDVNKPTTDKPTSTAQFKIAISPEPEFLINCTVNGLFTMALIDTGGHTSFITRGLADKCGLLHLEEKISTTIIFVGGNLDSKGRINACPVQIGNTLFSISFTIMEQNLASQGMILGIDFISSYMCVINRKESTLTIKTSRNTEPPRFSLRNFIVTAA